MSEELMTLAEVKEALEEIRLRRADEPEELGYELRRAIKHAEIFSQGTGEEGSRMTEELSGLEKMTPEIATKIADIRPRTKDEIRALYAKERFTLSDEDLDAILDVVLRG
ncbi:MAG TPA: RNA polymerase Rpb4 family protein [Methanothrix sp.]|nr:RNA polymerase Rpb4 family protein [Methanothrix sp.]HPJ84085.1 RNA polymerase Rpb4 family protein [Methanothrix sp.]HPR66609.1 RNA polymerase Rpb4 family protein [Methanothrix sp.]